MRQILTEKNKADIRQLRAKGIDSHTIASTLNVTYTSVIALICRESLPNVKPSTSIWTDEMNKKLVELYSQQLTLYEMEKILHINWRSIAEHAYDLRKKEGKYIPGYLQTGRPAYIKLRKVKEQERINKQ